MQFPTSTSRTRSATGCFTCKTKHKKCDETKPRCLRCQKSGIECPGYIYIQDTKKPNRRPRTLPGPRTRVGRPGAATQQENRLVNAEDTYLGEQDRLPLGASEASSSSINTSVNENAGKRTGPTIRSSRLSPTSSSNPAPIPFPPSVEISKSLTAGQASLLEALFSLAQPPDVYPPNRHSEPAVNCFPNPSLPPVPNQSPSEIKKQGDVTSHEDDDPEGLGVSSICRQPVLDKTLESNALPFVLQSYSAWIGRIAFEPPMLTGAARDFVFSYFEDGDNSRWIIGLIANIGSRIENVEPVEGKPNPMISTLHTTVRRRLAAAKSRPNIARLELVRTLASAVETMIIHMCVSPFSEVMTLRQEAASIFRQLCPQSPNLTIDLLSLLQSPLACLRNFASMDIVVCATLDLPSLFRYDVRLDNDDQSAPTGRGHDILQCMHGLPNQMVLLFAKMQSMREDKLTPDEETVASLERYIRECQPFDDYSNDRYFAIIRFVVQECWRQAAYVFLYMAVCGDPAGTPRVEESFQRYIKLLSATNPGRMPDEFIIGTLLVMSPAAQRQCDREAIRERAFALHRRGQTFRVNLNIIFVIEDYWSRADAERRKVMWSDVAVSRRRVAGS